ncbi:MAG: CRTAC1 family protein [Planctomycetota bacterium]
MPLRSLLRQRTLLLLLFTLAALTLIGWGASLLTSDSNPSEHRSSQTDSQGESDRQPTHPRTPGTLRMVKRLAELAASEAMLASPYRNDVAAERLLQRFEDGRSKKPRQLQLQLAQQLLLAGRTRESITQLEDILEQVGDTKTSVRDDLRRQIEDLLALAWLRAGEEDNCISMHGPDSCLLPIRGGGVHRNQTGSRRAIALYEKMLQEDPTDLVSRWLLNVAYMTIGEHPASVPPAALIPADRFESAEDIGRFPDVAGPLGLAVESNAGGSTLEDFNGDGFLDVLATGMGVDDPIRYLQNDGRGYFEDRSIEAGLQGLHGGLNFVTADYDNDGDVDVLVLRGGWFSRESGYQPNSLLRNRGDGTFDDVTEEAGLLSLHPTQTAAWGDIDGDGDLDLFIGNESAGRFHHPSELYRNEGDGTFQDIAAKAGVQCYAFIKGCVFGDIDNDGRIDLYVTSVQKDEPNHLFRNVGTNENGITRFEDITQAAGVAGPQCSFPCFFFDYDNDGWQDLFVSGYRAGPAIVAAEYLGIPHDKVTQDASLGLPCLYRNNRDGTFTDVAPELGLTDAFLTMGCNFGDLDNDGWLDFYLGTGSPDFRALVPNRMLRNDGGRRFVDVTTSGGFGHLQKGHGISFADLDHDGDQDIYAELGGAYTADGFRNALFENPGHGNRWVTLELEGSKSNRSAIGARVRLRLTTPSGPRSLHRVVGTGGSFGCNSLRLEVGLGDATLIESVTVRWPGTDSEQTFTELEPGKFYRLREGDVRPVGLDRPHVPLGSTQADSCCVAESGSGPE